MSVLRDAAGCDHEAARLLPWLVAGALSEQETRRVREHMRDCAVCEADWQREQQLQSLLCDEPVVEHAPQPGLQKLMVRIDELEREMPPPAVLEQAPAATAGGEAAPLLPSHRFRMPHMSPVRWLAAAAIVQTIGLGVLAVLLWQRGAELRAPRFHTLSSVSASAHADAQVRVVFAPDLAAGEMQALLKSISATVISGPSEAGVYTLALTGSRAAMDPALATLRAHAGVLFAEPLPSVGARE